VIRWKGRHLWNPSNFAICTMLLIAPEFFSTLMTQWGNTLWPMLIVWALGAVITYRVKRFHITATYVLSFILFSFIRTQITGHPFFAELAPITGPPYQLYIFFMITDPRTTVSTKRGQIIVAFFVAVAEALFRLAHNVDAPYYALTVVGPVAMVIDLWRQDRKKQLAKQSAGTKLQTAS
jgi:Na+-translocating ferredoxin:NAD+ oxidoreductase RnfD subunit